MEELFNKSTFRISIGIIFGIPLTFALGIYAAYGLFFGYLGLGYLASQMKTSIFLLFGLLALLGVLGILGAWMRIFKTSTSMSGMWRDVTRILLLCGVICAASLSIVGFYSSLSGLELMLLMISAGGLAFVYATPKISSR